MGRLQHVIVAVTAFFAAVYITTDYNSASPQHWMEILEIMESYGYKGEEHTVFSEDGFKIAIHRFSNLSARNGIPVLIVPGIHCSSQVFVNLGPSREIAYRLYDEGFDVWIANYRGNKFATPLSRNLTHFQKNFFSFHEQGVLDLPPAIDFILNYTGQRQLQIYTGSLGNSIVLAMLATRPEYNLYVNKVISAGPVGIFSSATTNFHQFVLFIMLHFGNAIHALIPSPSTYRYVTYFAFLHPVTSRINPLKCLGVLQHFLGVKIMPTDEECATLANSIVTGSVAGLYHHMATMFGNDKFRMRDYGREENLRRYQQEVPPEYNVKAVTVPFRYYVLKDDTFLTPQGYERMLQELPNAHGIIPIKHPLFSHFNFFSDSQIDEEFVEDVLVTLRAKQMLIK